MLKKVRNYWDEASGTVKYLFILALLYTIMSVVLIVCCNTHVSEMEENLSQGVFAEENRNLFALMGLEKLFEKFKYAAVSCFAVVINILFYYVSYWMGKILGFFKGLTEFCSDIKDDKVGAFALLYDVIVGMFDMYTLFSFVQLVFVS